MATNAEAVRIERDPPLDNDINEGVEEQVFTNDEEDGSADGSDMFDSVSLTTTFTLVVTDAMDVETERSITVTALDEQAAINSFSAVPDEDGEVTLTWSTTYATTVEIVANPGGPLTNATALSGTVSAGTPVLTTVYTLTATGKNAIEVIDTERVTVTGTAPPPTATLTAARETVPEGEEIVLSWTTTYASSVTITANPGGPLTNATMSGTAMSGSATFVAERVGVTEYTLRATGPTGRIADSTVVSITVNAAAPATATLTAEPAPPALVAYGADVVLGWTTENAASISIMANPGGPVDLEDADGEVPDNGMVTVMPTTTTTYTLTATPVGQGQSPAIDTVTVNVNPPREPGISSFDADMETTTPFGSVTLSWVTTNAVSGTLTAAPGGTTFLDAAEIAATGPLNPYEVAPTETTVYTLTAIGERDTDTVSETVTVTVTEAENGGFIRTVLR